MELVEVSRNAVVFENDANFYSGTHYCQCITLYIGMTGCSLQHSIVVAKRNSIHSKKPLTETMHERSVREEEVKQYSAKSDDKNNWMYRCKNVYLL